MMKRLLVFLILFTSILVADTFSLVGSQLDGKNKTLGVSYERGFGANYSAGFSYLRSSGFVYKRCGCKTFRKTLNRFELNSYKRVYGNYVDFVTGLGYTSKKAFNQGLYIPFGLRVKYDGIKLDSTKTMSLVLQTTYLANLRDVRSTIPEIRMLLGVKF